MGKPSIAELRKTFGGEVIVPGDAAYDAARRVWNGMIDRRPAVIARCAGAGDVARAVAFGRANDLPVAIRGGAHNVAGHATVDDGIVVDLSRMKRIAVDEAARTATAEPGVTWGEFDRATAAHGLATTGGLVSTTGIAGFTLGGGIGWLQRSFGLTCDNLVRAELLTADGAAVAASAQENPELFWALRGGGGNFGVVTSFQYRLHPVASVVGGLTLYPAKMARAALRHFRELCASAPDCVTLLFAFATAPPAPFVPEPLRNAPAVAIMLCDASNGGEGRRTVEAVKAWGPPAADAVGPMPYPALQSMVDAGAPAGSLNYWKSCFLDELSDGAIGTLVEHAAQMGPGLCQVHVHQMGGAVARVEPSSTAFAHRRAAFTVNVIGMWTDAAETDRRVAWARGFAAALDRHSNGGVYVNFLADEGQDRVRAAYGDATYARLAAVKARFDPSNVFRLNQNIRPARAGGGGGPR